MKAIYYLASPYSHKRWWVRWYRWYKVCQVGAILTKQGYTLLEPIAMCHWNSFLFGLPPGYDFWKSRDRAFIERSDGLFVLTLPGWKESVGVQDEIIHAKRLGKPIQYLELYDNKVFQVEIKD